MGKAALLRDPSKRRQYRKYLVVVRTFRGSQALGGSREGRKQMQCWLAESVRVGGMGSQEHSHQQRQLAAVGDHEGGGWMETSAVCSRAQWH